MVKKVQKKRLLINAPSRFHSPRIRGWKGELEPQNLNQMKLSPKETLEIKEIKPFVVVLSLDGVLFDNFKRYNYALKKYPNKQRNFWNLYFSNNLLQLDVIKDGTTDLLKKIEQFGLGFIYISGRRIDSYEITLAQMQKHDFPEGKIYLRGINQPQNSYKKDVFKRILLQYNVALYVGNRLSDNELIHEIPVPMYNVQPGEKWDTDDIGKIINEIRKMVKNGNSGN